MLGLPVSRFPAPVSSDIAARDLEVFWHPCSQMRDYRDFPPLEIVGARGTRLQLADGRQVLDAIASWWCKSLGHGHPRLIAALPAQAQRGAPGRTRFAAFENGYHGETVGALSVGDLDLYAAPYRPRCFPVERLTGLPYRVGPHDPAWLDASREWPAIEAALDVHASALAAVVYEPVLQAAGGMRFYSPDLLRR